ncbi:TAXI family TRAP transporter solute-binding subunit [Pararhodobacter zhoushanensis]|uniref:TAXI family TRAP transporter solute-binding subunit n=1 Tax=Pararhodobacter zhoushanensis TaxID=2479545 RepID=A0ABT3GV81_9RHOB|nr:TAXI family TRAP transporter solute-binding subunit [Pararhodobacter zhoushanensis]MCW1931446.1 TAXI family TRAP transporter solute-binding subunit [Pararhodobacter zhoushanensis]
MKLRHTIAGFALGLAALAGPAQAQEYFRLATLGPGSSPYLVMSTFAQIVNDALPDVEVQVNATGAATQHALEAGAGQLDFFMWSASVHQLMIGGQAMYANIPQAAELSTHLRAVLAFPLGPYHITTYADSGIESLDDLRGHSVFLGPPGGGATAIMQRTVEAATGLVAGTDYDQVQLGWDAAAQAFQDGRIDVYINSTLAPSPVIQQMALTRDIRFLGLTAEQLAMPGVQAIMNRPGGVLVEIPAGIYGDGQVNTEAVTVPGSIVGIGAGEHVDAEAVYAMTKAFWEGVEGMGSSAPWLRAIQLDHALDALNLPLHPGALRYYEEIGMDIPDALRPPM